MKEDFMEWLGDLVENNKRATQAKRLNNMVRRFYLGLLATLLIANVVFLFLSSLPIMAVVILLLVPIGILCLAFRILR